MAKITAARRRALPRSDFVFPDREAYPDDTIGRARNALSRGAQNASPSQLAKIKAKVHRDYPSIRIAGSKGGYVPNPAQNAAIHAKGSHPRMHALALASATHLKNMGHITPEHHARIERHVNNALTQMRGPQPAMPSQPQPEAAPFGSFAPPSTAGYA